MRSRSVFPVFVTGLHRGILSIRPFLAMIRVFPVFVTGLHRGRVIIDMEIVTVTSLPGLRGRAPSRAGLGGDPVVRLWQVFSVFVTGLHCGLSYTRPTFGPAV